MRNRALLILITAGACAVLISACGDDDPIAPDEYVTPGLSLDMFRWYWKPASEPMGATTTHGIPIFPHTRVAYSYYYHSHGSTFRRDFDPGLIDSEHDEEVRVLCLSLPRGLNMMELEVFPDLAPTNDFNNALGDSAWTGLMCGFTIPGIDLSGFDFVDLWVNDYRQETEDRLGVLHLELGGMDEDFWEPEKNWFETENQNHDEFFDLGEEDTGLDGVPDRDEEFSESPFSTYYDRGGDDYNSSLMAAGFPNSYFKSSGMEGNRLFDTEDLDGDSSFDSRSSYFELICELRNTGQVEMTQVYLTETGQAPSDEKAWRMYRLYLNEAQMRIEEGETEPRWDKITHARFWIEDLGDPSESSLKHLEVASIRFGNHDNPPPW